MRSRASTGLFEPETSLSQRPQDYEEWYLYYCGLCDEVLAVSRRLINPRKMCLVFNDCPRCGFELERVLRCEVSRIPAGTGLFPNPTFSRTDCITYTPNKAAVKVSSGSVLPHDLQSNLATGIEALDQALVLRFGQLAVLQGAASHILSLLLCVRALLPQPLGPDTDAVFVDGGNLFDTYTISRYLIEHGFDPRGVRGRVHISRAFTFHQLSSIVTEKLPVFVDRLDAKLVVVSDITQLYCDPDVKDEQEACTSFAKTVRFLGDFAEQRRVLVVATALKPRNRRMDSILFHTAHVSAELHDREALTQLTLEKHPFIPPRRASFPLAGASSQTLLFSQSPKSSTSF